MSEGNRGFVTDLEQVHGSKCLPIHKKKIMSYYPLDSLPALHTLGRNFTVCDRWFSSLPGPTWPNRFFALSGTTKGFLKMPEHGENLEMFWNQDQPTIFDRLTEKNKSWRVFYYDLPCSLILGGLDKKSHILSNYQLIDEYFKLCEEGDEEDFPEFCFIEPKYFGVDQNDDHPPHNVMKAQKLIADVYNALRSNPALFSKTLLVVTYDEHGGFYDHVIPPAATPPDEKADQYTFDQYGIRVPTILISPWVKADVENKIFDHTSLLKYLIEKWDLAPLGKRTSTANSISCVIQSEPRKIDDLPGFIRIPFSKLVSPNPELEIDSENTNNLALKTFAALLKGGMMSAGVGTISQLAKEKNLGLSNWKSLKYIVGTFVVNLGKKWQLDGLEDLKKQYDISDLMKKNETPPS